MRQFFHLPRGLFIVMILGLSNISFAQIQTQEDSYTRYELLTPESHSFRIVYDVSATTAGAKYYYNTLRKGSEHHVDAVYDLMTGQPLQWEIVDGLHAQKNGHTRASQEYEYLKVILARPVPAGGAARIRIDKTYKDPKSYYSEKGQIIFDRSLGIKRNAVLLPKGYELVACNYPSQVVMEADGRLKMSFMNRGASSVPYKLVAKVLSPSALSKKSNSGSMPWESYEKKASGRDKSHARLDYKFSERSLPRSRDCLFSSATRFSFL